MRSGIQEILLVQHSGVLLAAVFATGVVGYLFHAVVARRISVDQYVALADNLWLCGVMAAGFSFLHWEASFAFARDDRRVLLVLLMAVAGIILGIGLYHEFIRQVAICINIVLVAGYAGVLALNAYYRKLGD